MPTVLCPGSFDPFHLGHLDVIEQASALFGPVIVATMHNPAKPSGMFTLDERMALIEASVAHLPEVKVVSFAGLVVDAAREFGADFLLKGLRTAADFEIEQQMAQTNYKVAEVRTVFVPCHPNLSYISSQFIREIARHGGDVRNLVPPPVAEHLAGLSTADPQSSR